MRVRGAVTTRFRAVTITITPLVRGLETTNEGKREQNRDIYPCRSEMGEIFVIPPRTRERTTQGLRRAVQWYGVCRIEG